MCIQENEMVKRRRFCDRFREVEALEDAFCEGSCRCCSSCFKMKAGLRRSTNVKLFLPMISTVKYFSCLATTLKGPSQGAENEAVEPCGCG